MKTTRNTSSGKRTIIAPSGIVLFIVILFWITGGQKSFAQGVGISEATITPDATAILELRSTLRGLLTPRLTTAQRDLIAAPATGLLIYNTDTNAFNYYNGTDWIAILNTGTGVTSVSGTLNRISVIGTTTPVIDIHANYIGQTSISTLGTITSGTWNGTRIGLLYGGTNTDLSGGAAIGDILFANSATSFARRADIAVGNALISGGVGVAPTWGKIGLTTHVSGTLPIANGGTGQTTKLAAFNALSPITTLGDMIYGSAANTSTRLAGNTSVTSMFLKQTGTGAVSAAPVWTSIAKSDVGLSNVENTALSTWTGSTNLITLGTITSGTWNGTVIGIANGGTGQTTQQSAINSLSGGATAGQYLRGDGANVVLSLIQVADIPTLNQNTTGTANIAGGTLGAIPYQTAANSTGILAATAVANKVLMSGADAAPFWSTPTFPNISATSRKIIVSDGTNWIASAETYAVPGLAGNLMVSDGTNWTSALPIFNQNTTGSAAKWTTPRNLAGNSVDGSANVSFANKFIVQGTTDAGLSGAQFLGALNTGLLKNTTTTGVLSIATSGTDYSAGTSALNTGILKSTTATGALSIAVAGDFPTLNQNTTGTASNVTGIVAVVNGGTGLNTFGGINTVLYTTAANTLSSVTASAAAGQFLQTTASGGIPTWKTILSVANGGTGQITAPAAFNALSPITTLGDIIYGSAPNTSTRLPGNTSLTPMFLKQTGTGAVSAAPVWTSIAKSDVGLGLVDNIALTTWTGSTNITTLGTITAGTWNGSIIGLAYGGTNTNLSGSAAIGDILFANTATSFARLPDIATGNALISGGVGAPPSWGKIGLTTHVSGILPIANGGTGSSTWSFWNIDGNAGTTGTAGTNFIGTTDGQELVFKTNSIERARLYNSASDTSIIRIGNAGTVSGTIKANKELVLRQDGDLYGPSILRLRNRNAENGAIFETTHPAFTLVDFLFRTSGPYQRNIRFEARTDYAKTGVPSFHFGGAIIDYPTLSIGDNYAVFNKRVRIGTYPDAYNTPFPSPTALLHLEAGTTALNTAPLKFTAGTNLTSPEAGAVEFDGTNYFVTTVTTRYTLAKTLTVLPLNFNVASTTSGSYSDVIVNIGLTGAADADVVVLGIPSALIYVGTVYTAWVSAANTVTVRFINNSGATIDPPSTNILRISVLKY